MATTVSDFSPPIIISHLHLGRQGEDEWILWDSQMKISEELKIFLDPLIVFSCDFYIHTS